MLLTSVASWGFTSCGSTAREMHEGPPSNLTPIQTQSLQGWCPGHASHAHIVPAATVLYSVRDDVAPCSLLGRRVSYKQSVMQLPCGALRLTGVGCCDKA